MRSGLFLELSTNYLENYAELGAKRARFSVFPTYFVFLRYTLKLGSSSSHSQKLAELDLKAVFNFSVLKLTLLLCMYVCFVCVETTLGTPTPQPQTSLMNLYGLQFHFPPV